MDVYFHWFVRVLEYQQSRRSLVELEDFGLIDNIHSHGFELMVVPSVCFKDLIKVSVFGFYGVFEVEEDGVGRVQDYLANHVPCNLLRISLSRNLLSLIEKRIPSEIIHKINYILMPKLFFHLINLLESKSVL